MAAITICSDFGAQKNKVWHCFHCFPIYFLAEEPDIKLPTSAGSSKKQESSRKTSTSALMTSWEIDGETVETVSDFIFRGSKITADDYCRHEIKRRLLLGRKVMTNLDNIFKSRDIANKGPSSQSYGFSSSQVWMWKLDSRKLSTKELMLLNCSVG